MNRGLGQFTPSVGGEMFRDMLFILNVSENTIFSLVLGGFIRSNYFIFQYRKIKKRARTYLPPTRGSSCLRRRGPTFYHWK